MVQGDTRTALLSQMSAKAASNGDALSPLDLVDEEVC